MLRKLDLVDPISLGGTLTSPLDMKESFFFASHETMKVAKSFFSTPLQVEKKVFERLEFFIYIC